MLTARNTFSRIFAASATSGDERHRGVERLGVDSADHLGDRLRVEVAVARVLALGREGQEEVAAAPEAARLEARQELLARRPRIGGRLEHHQLARAQALRDLVSRVPHVGEVGLAVRAERRRHAHHDRVALRQAVEGGGRLDAPALERLRDTLLADVADVRLTARERLFLPGVDVEADHREAALLEQQRERQPHVPEPDHPDPRLLVRDLRRELHVLVIHSVWRC
jgi:hypothetical protein